MYCWVLCVVVDCGELDVFVVEVFEYEGVL